MFKSMKQLFTSTNKDLRHRIYFTLGALMIFILGISIRVPGTKSLTANLDFLGLLNTLGGGAMKNFSIFALGVMPYITASIIMQLLQMDVIPYLTELSKQGATGRQKINQITRYMGIVFAFIEGYAMAFALVGKTANVQECLYIATVLFNVVIFKFSRIALALCSKKGIENNILISGLINVKYLTILCNISSISCVLRN